MREELDMNGKTNFIASEHGNRYSAHSFSFWKRMMKKKKERRRNKKNKARKRMVIVNFL
jgi:hypothetical protein